MGNLLWSFVSNFFWPQTSSLPETSNRLNTGPYIVDAGTVLGSGAFGIVHTAKHCETDKLVAAKRIDIKDKNKCQKIAQNSENLLSLKHENIAAVFHIVSEPNTVWMFMEFCDKGDLVEFLKTEDFGSNNVSMEEKLGLMRGIGSGVQFLHSKDIIHRDIKPSNILVSGVPAVAKLTDFDRSKFLEQPRKNSEMSSNVGTQAFKPPEFYERTPDHKLKYHRNVDIYSLGLSFLAMIQENDHLIPRIETPNDPSELVIYPIGLLMWERQKYDVKPFEVVDLDISETDEERDVRELILKMTNLKPEGRITADGVVLGLAKIIDKQWKKEDQYSLEFDVFPVSKATQHVDFDVENQSRPSVAVSFWFFV